MQNLKLPLIATVLLIILFIVVLNFRNKQVSPTINTDNQEQLSVVASFYPLAEFSRQIGGERVNVEQVVPAGIEVHDFEPTPNDIVKINEADVFIFNGNGLDPWADRLIANGELDSVKIIKASDLIESLESEADSHGHGGNEEHNEEIFDPHFWLELSNVQKIIAKLEDVLSEIDQINSDYYQANFQSYNSELSNLNNEFESKLKSCQLNKIVTSHNAFEYMARAYNFDIVHVTGLNPDADPSPAKIAEIIEIVNNENIDIIFYESAVNNAVANTIGSETGASVMILNAIETITPEQQASGENYLSLMSQNLDNLELALKCS